MKKTCGGGLKKLRDRWFGQPGFKKKKKKGK